MSDFGAFMVGFGVALAGWLVAHGLDAIGDAVKRLSERLK